ncbi:MAG: transposase [Desulfobacterales bacterium]|nr:transposase [Desulfobacterales bacterium]
MKTILRIGRGVKVRRARVKEICDLPLKTMDIDVKTELIQALIPLGLWHLKEVLEQEVTALAGERYKRQGITGYDRWGKQWGSVYLRDQKLPILVPRVRNQQEDKEIRLRSYERLQEPRNGDEGVLKRILHGLSCRNYEVCAEAVPEAFGLSGSTVSKRYIRASARELKRLCERRLEGYDFVALFLDGKIFGTDEMVIALGVTVEGRKMPLGFVQTGTENERVGREMIEGLLERGLKIADGLLCVIDGSKGLRKALYEVLGGKVLVQRCQWHKRENVIGYLPKGMQGSMRRRLQEAYEEPTYEKAKEKLLKIRKELQEINRSAVNSLDEGFEETLTLHRLGLFQELGISFKTTNCMESLMALIAQKTDKVDYWKNSDQKHRWLAAALLDIEPRLRRVKRYRYLPQLRVAIQRVIQMGEGNHQVREAA